MTVTPAIAWATRSTADRCACQTEPAGWNEHRDLPRHERPDLGALTSVLGKSEPQLSVYNGPPVVPLPGGMVQAGKSRPYEPKRATAGVAYEQERRRQHAEYLAAEAEARQAS